MDLSRLAELKRMVSFDAKLAPVLNLLALVGLPEHHIVHGSFFIGFRIGGVISCEDIDGGVMNLCEGVGSPDVKYVCLSDAHNRKPGYPHHN